MCDIFSSGSGSWSGVVEDCPLQCLPFGSKSSIVSICGAFYYKKWSIVSCIHFTNSVEQPHKQFSPIKTLPGLSNLSWNRHSSCLWWNCVSAHFHPWVCGIQLASFHMWNTLVIGNRSCPDKDILYFWAIFHLNVKFSRVNGLACILNLNTNDAWLWGRLRVGVGNVFETFF